MMDHVGPVLTETEDRTPVERTIKHILTNGNGTGAHRQRTLMHRTGNLRKVILDAAQRHHRNRSPVP